MNDSQQAVQKWLQGRVPAWRELERQCREADGAKQDSSQPALDFITGFRALGRDLSLARSTLPGSQLTAYLEHLFVSAHGQIYRRPQTLGRSLQQTFLYEAPSVVRRLRGAIIATLTLFVLAILTGWWLVSQYPDLASLFASQKMMDTVESGALWTDDLLNILPSSVLAFSIITNNVSVTLFAFVLGAFYGVGTVYIIALNGLMLGGVFAFTAQYGLHQRLFEFVIAHGVVELSVICLAGAAGVALGEALIRPGEHSRAVAFRLAVRQAGALLLVAIPFLIGAGLIESYISPDARFGLPFRIGVGVVYGLLFWWVLLGGFWARRSAAAKPAAAVAVGDNAVTGVGRDPAAG